MDNSPAVKNLDFENKQVLDTLRATIAPDATAPEFSMFVEFCKSTGLNPFKKEIWFIKSKPYTKKNGDRVDAKVQMMVGVNGFYSIANSHPAYDGMEEVEFEVNDKHEVISAKAKVWRKDRRFPSVGVARWDEYAPERTDFNKNSIWFTKPYVMIGKVAESIALRKAFPQELNGLYTSEEMPVSFAAKKEPVEDESIIRDLKHEKHTLELYEEPRKLEASLNDLDWALFKYRYHIPVKKAGKDMEAVREALRKRGFIVNKQDWHWYGNVEVKKLEQYLRPLGEPETIIDDVPQIDENYQFTDEDLGTEEPHI